MQLLSRQENITEPHSFIPFPCPLSTYVCCESVICTLVTKLAWISLVLQAEDFLITDLSNFCYNFCYIFSKLRTSVFSLKWSTQAYLGSTQTATTTALRLQIFCLKKNGYLKANTDTSIVCRKTKTATKLLLRRYYIQGWHTEVRDDSQSKQDGAEWHGISLCWWEGFQNIWMVCWFRWECLP